MPRRWLQVIKKIWIAWRRWSGDDAYVRYMRHLCASHMDPQPLSETEFWRWQMEAGPHEICHCCSQTVILFPRANHARLKRLLQIH